MPNPMQLVLGVAALVGIGVLFLLGRRFAEAWLTYRGTRVVVCPESRQAVAIEVDASHAALGATQGRPRLRLDACTRWPERRNCGQECLAQVESAPGACLLRGMLGDWYQGRTCAFCGRAFGAQHWHDHEPSLLAPDGTLVDWSSVPPEQVLNLLPGHEPVCWDCRVAEGFRREHPELVTDRPQRTSRPPSMA